MRSVPSLSEICVEQICEWTLENVLTDVEDVIHRIKSILDNLENVLLPPTIVSNFKTILISKFNTISASNQYKETYNLPNMQKELIPLIAFLVKQTGVFCLHYNPSKYMRSQSCKSTIVVLETWSNNRIADLINAVLNLDLSAFHYDYPFIDHSYPPEGFPLLAFDFVLKKLTRLETLNELSLGNVNFRLDPVDLKSLKTLDSLILYNVRGVSDVLLAKLTCKLTFPKLTKFYYSSKAYAFYALENHGEYENLKQVVNHGLCDCEDVCFFKLKWMHNKPVSLPFGGIYSGILSAMGIPKENHVTINNKFALLPQIIEYSIQCTITGNFGMLRELTGPVPLFAWFARYLSSSPVPRISLQKYLGAGLADEEVDTLSDMLARVPCEELVFQYGYWEMKKSDISTMMKSVRAQKVILKYKSSSNEGEKITYSYMPYLFKMEDLKKLFPSVEFIFKNVNPVNI